MSPEQVVLAIIVVLSACYFMIRDPSDDVKPGRDLRKEHALGAHRHTPAWGCPECK